MKDDIEFWYQDLQARSSYILTRKGEAWGECDRHSGPSWFYAKVLIAIEPHEEFLVINQLDKNKADRMELEDWFDQIVFGVLDVMLSAKSYPCKSFQLVILDIDFDEIDSKPIAFRLAARDATAKILAN